MGAKEGILKLHLRIDEVGDGRGQKSVTLGCKLGLSGWLSWTEAELVGTLAVLAGDVCKFMNRGKTSC